MNLPSERQKRLVTSKYRREVSKLQSYWPASFITLEEAMSSNKPGIPLLDGTFHEFDPEHIKGMAREIPKILWPLINLPILLHYERDSTGRTLFRVAGDSWQRRAVALLLTGELTADGKSVLEASEALELLSKYRSLFFVTLKL